MLGGTKFGKVIWEYYYYCFICLCKVWCRKIKIDLQVIMIIWGEETEPLLSLSLSLCFHSSPFIFLCLFGIFVFLGGERPLRPPPQSESASDTYLIILIPVHLHTSRYSEIVSLQHVLFMQWEIASYLFHTVPNAAQLYLSRDCVQVRYHNTLWRWYKYLRRRREAKGKKSSFGRISKSFEQIKDSFEQIKDSFGRVSKAFEQRED